MQKQTWTGEHLHNHTFWSHANDQARLLEGYYPDVECNGSNPFQLLRQEILLSYRVLFGQHRQAIKWYRTQRRKKATSAKENIDPLLDILCSERLSSLHSMPKDCWPESCRDAQGHLQEQDVYSSELDFLMLGPRLLALQAFSLRHQPSRVRDLWRDRRNPLQWYTFWAVLVVGGMSLVLTAFQCVVAIAQLVLAGKAYQHGIDLP